MELQEYEGIGLKTRHFRIPLVVFDHLDIALLQRHNATRPKSAWLIPQKPNVDDAGFSDVGGATLAIITDDQRDGIAVGFSLCSLEDEYDYELGEKIAIGRARAVYNGRDGVKYGQWVPHDPRYSVSTNSMWVSMYNLVHESRLLQW